jgi:hypothetical protein
MADETEPTQAPGPDTPKEVFEKQAAEILNAPLAAPVEVAAPVEEPPKPIGFARTEPLHKPELIAAAEGKTELACIQEINRRSRTLLRTCSKSIGRLSMKIRSVTLSIGRMLIDSGKQSAGLRLVSSSATIVRRG